MTRLHALATEVRNPNSSISVFMRERFPHLSGIQAEFRGQVASLPTIRPDPGAGTPPYATIGAAVDYRLRYYFRKTIIQTMDAFRGATYAISLRDGAMGEYVSVPMYGAEVAKDLDQRVPVPRVASDFFDSLLRHWWSR